MTTTDPYNAKHLVGSLPEERYASGEYRCNKCHNTYQTYYTYKILGHFLNAPERWSCPVGCMHKVNDAMRSEPLPVELLSRNHYYDPKHQPKYNPHYVPHYNPNYAKSTPEYEITVMEQWPTDIV